MDDFYLDCEDNTLGHLLARTNIPAFRAGVADIVTDAENECAIPLSRDSGMELAGVEKDFSTPVFILQKNIYML